MIMEKNEKLIEACEKNDINTVRELLKKRFFSKSANANCEDNEGYTPLCIASEHGHIEVFKYLIKAGADVNKAIIDGITPLIIASEKGHHNLVKLLIKAKANVNKSMEGQVTPLFIASQNGYPEVVKLLVDSGANVDKARIADNLTSLFIAANVGHDKVVKILIEGGANVNIDRNDDVSALFMAAQENYPKVVKHLIDAGADINKPINDGSFPLFIAAQEGNYNVIKHLVDAGANLNLLNNLSASPLMIASQKGHYEVVKYLIDAGANVNQTDEDGFTSLCGASSKGDFEMVKIFVESGADINKPTKKGATPISVAETFGHTEIINYLKSKGAKAKDNQLKENQNQPDQISTFVDSRDGKEYKTVKIGNQLWMAENLAFDCGEGCCAFDNDINNVEKFGYLYDWETAQEICPSGWHLPSVEEWEELESYLVDNGFNYDDSIGGGGEKIGKSVASNSTWESYDSIGAVGNDIETNNSSGFSALPGGHLSRLGDFGSLGIRGYWWSSSEFDEINAWYWHLSFVYCSARRLKSPKYCAFSVRCIKDIQS